MSVRNDNPFQPETQAIDISTGNPDQLTNHVFWYWRMHYCITKSGGDGGLSAPLLALNLMSVSDNFVFLANRVRGASGAICMFEDGNNPTASKIDER
jgi:hypothetical protein